MIVASLPTIALSLALGIALGAAGYGFGRDVAGWLRAGREPDDELELDERLLRELEERRRP